MPLRARQHWKWRPRPSIHGKTAQAGARPSFTTAATTSSDDDSNCKHDLSLRLQCGNAARSNCAHSKQEVRSLGQPVSHPPAATYDATTTYITSHRRRRQRLSRHALHSQYTTNSNRQLVCSACSGEAKAFFLVPAFSTIPLKRPQSTTSAKSEELSHSTTQNCTRWERLQPRAFPSGMSERWLDASVDGRKCLLRWRMTRLEPVPGPQKILNKTETQKLC
jgi:hypothetical protein